MDPKFGDDDRYSEKINFEWKGIGCHLKDILWSWKLILVWFSVFAALWTVAEATTQLLDPGIVQPSAPAYLTLLTASAIGAVGWRIFSYFNEIPPGGERFSNQAQRIAHLQRPRWECELLQQFLVERLSPLDGELSDIANGLVFVPRRVQMEDVGEYMNRSVVRMENLSIMSNVLLDLCQRPLHRALGGKVEPIVKIAALNSVAKSFGQLYEDAVAFERDLDAVFPPETLELLHETQRNWSQPIRDGVANLLVYLQKLRDAEDDTVATFTLELDEPPNVQEFNAEIERISNNQI